MAAAVRTRVRVLHTGGTMGMRLDESGSLAPQAHYLTEQMEEFRTLEHDELPHFEVKEYSPLLDSADMGAEDWQLIAKDVEADYYEFDGFVIIAGTDTMAFLASALSFMLENLGKPVVVTGSQIPIAAAHSDARRNLLLALIFAGRGDEAFHEVCILFHDKLLRGNRATKVNSVHLDAFMSPNFPPLAEVGVEVVARHDLAVPPPRNAFRVQTGLDSNILCLKLIPGYDDSCLIDIVAQSRSVRAVIFLFYGTGNAPGRKSRLLQAIRTAHDRGILTVALTQCLRGGVAMGTYAVGKAMADAGVISGGDMTTEACATKLAYLFGKGLGTDEIARVLACDLRGEITAPRKRARL